MNFRGQVQNGRTPFDWQASHPLSPCQGGVPRSGEGVKKLNNLAYLRKGVGSVIVEPLSPPHLPPPPFGTPPLGEKRGQVYK